MASYLPLQMWGPISIWEQYPPGTPPFWYHFGCGGQLEIGSDAQMRCAGCGHVSHVKHWRYTSSESNMADDKRSTTVHLGLTNAVVIAGQASALAPNR